MPVCGLGGCGELWLQRPACEAKLAVVFSKPKSLCENVSKKLCIPVTGRDVHETLKPETDTRPRRDVCGSRDVTETLK